MGRSFVTLLMVRPGQVVKWPLKMALIHVVLLGLKQHAWRYWSNSVVLVDGGLMMVAAWAQWFLGERRTAQRPLAAWVPVKRVFWLRTMVTSIEVKVT